MFNAIVQNMEEARRKNDLVSTNFPESSKDFQKFRD